MPTAALDALASLLRYPGPDHALRVERCLRAVEEELPAGAPLVVELRRRVQGLPLEALEELYTRTFDLDPVCAPELGWHLFGEQYERGLFLVKLKQLRRRVGLDDGTELPDHLAGVLELLDRLPPAEAADLAWACVLPALEKMRQGLGGKDSPYASAIDLAAILLEARHPPPPADEAERPAPAPRPGLHVLEEGSHE